MTWLKGIYALYIIGFIVVSLYAYWKFTKQAPRTSRSITSRPQWKLCVAICPEFVRDEKHLPHHCLRIQHHGGRCIFPCEAHGKKPEDSKLIRARRAGL